MWTMGHELFLTQFEAGESISAIPRRIRAIGHFQKSARPPKTYHGGSPIPRGGLVGSQSGQLKHTFILRITPIPSRMTLDAW